MITIWLQGSLNFCKFSYILDFHDVRSTISACDVNLDGRTEQPPVRFDCEIRLVVFLRQVAQAPFNINC